MKVNSTTGMIPFKPNAPINVEPIINKVTLNSRPPKINAGAVQCCR